MPTTRPERSFEAPRRRPLQTEHAGRKLSLPKMPSWQESTSSCVARQVIRCREGRRTSRRTFLKLPPQSPEKPFTVGPYAESRAPEVHLNSTPYSSAELAPATKPSTASAAPPEVPSMRIWPSESAGFSEAKSQWHSLETVYRQLAKRLATGNTKSGAWRGTL